MNMAYVKNQHKIANKDYFYTNYYYYKNKLKIIN